MGIHSETGPQCPRLPTRMTFHSSCHLTVVCFYFESISKLNSSFCQNPHGLVDSGNPLAGTPRTVLYLLGLSQFSHADNKD